MGNSGSAAAAIYTPDDRQTLALLSLPIFAMILGLGLTQVMKPSHRLVEMAKAPPPISATPMEMMGVKTARISPAPSAIAAKLDSTEVAANHPPLLEPRASETLNSSPASMTSADHQAGPSISLTPPSFSSSAIAPSIAPRAQIAMLAPAAHPAETIIASPLQPGLIAKDAPIETESNVCLASASLLSRVKPALAPNTTANLTSLDFGLALAAAAREQTRDLVIYNDKYRAISYPMGDVQSLYGVCTDVIIRAYRAVGIDLQQRVHEAHIGGGDTSIDHRRTETLRRFFVRSGDNLPASNIAEDYRPGDVVTYDRPQNRHSRSHIALVSDVIAPSGRYMIIHNRGWGPQLEDALFVDQITGHYRYRGLDARPPILDIALVATQIRPSALARVSQSRIDYKPALRRKDGASVRGLGR